MDLHEFRDIVRNEAWTFAKTYAKTAPHEYVVKGKTKVSEQKFKEIVQFIRTQGFPAYWYRECHIYLAVDGKYYWTMGNPVDETTIINRCKL